MTFALVLSPEWAETVRLGLAVCIPIIVGLLTKSSASSGLKATVNVVIAAFVTAATTILDDSSVHVAAVIREFIFTSVSSFATYYGVWKPTGVAGKVAAATPGFGIGSPPAPDLTAQEKGLEDLVVPPPVMEEIVDDLDAAPPKKAPPAKKAAARKRTRG